MVKRLASVLLQELVVFFPPGMIQEWEDFFSNGLQFFDADLLDSLLDRFAPGLSDSFNIEVFWFHNKSWVLTFSDRREKNLLS